MSGKNDRHSDLHITFSVILFVVLLNTVSCHTQVTPNQDCGRHRDEEIARWKDKWSNGDGTAQEQAIEWASQRYLVAGMQRTEVERLLGPGMRARSSEIVYAYLPRDSQSRYALWVYYRTTPEGEVVKSFSVTTTENGEERRRGQEKAPVKIGGE